MKLQVLTTLFFIWISLTLPVTVAAQQSDYARLQPGDRFPDYILNYVKYYAKSTVNTSEFKGRWLVLSFWNSHCSVCLKKMPEEDSLQRLFADSVQILLVGYTGSQYSRIKGPDQNRIQDLYEKVREKMNLSLPVAYDSTLFHRMDIAACPYLVIIDPAGIIKGITISMTPTEFKAIMNGEKPTLERAYRRWELKQEKATAQ